LSEEAAAGTAAFTADEEEEEDDDTNENEEEEGGGKWTERSVIDRQPSRMQVVAASEIQRCTSACCE
jgi:hypothetical protein